MSLHVVVGAGTIGRATALELAASGHQVRVVTRSGTGPSHPEIQPVSADATDNASLRPHVTGAEAIYNTASPPSYQHWETMWPPLASALLQAAESADAVLVTMSNLYGYGPVDGPISRDHPLIATEHKGRLRARLWHDALAAHDAGRVRVAEARASDFIGPGVGPNAGMITRYGLAAVAGKPVSMLSDPDVPHSWTYVPDVARTLSVLGTDERAWGHAWHVPSPPPVSPRGVVAQAAELAGAAPPRVRRIPRGLLRLLYPLSPLLREVGGVLYQWDRPFEIDAAATTDLFGLRPTAWDEIMNSTTKAWRHRRDDRNTRQSDQTS
ncbi:NAD-dependent epimerase/dehydratase family protein [Phytoactinopolyspora endophytica]|uniref:NAD-dependent epimerase/dehydratase family protein n=1 Tax=Phytoactinopolyspora endophytica TaxID=1642495 RepID=UPI00101BFDBF|nr:NAD-dependent epimerase/dehydratase family protein [Phytoactinopolyspora endophytica]